MTCRMPSVTVPQDIFNELNNKTDEISGTRINGSGVSKYVGSNGRDNFDIYIGFVLDGYRGLENFSSVRPDIKFIFYLKPPTIMCAQKAVVFDQLSQNHIIVQVGKLAGH